MRRKWDPERLGAKCGACPLRECEPIKPKVTRRATLAVIGQNPTRADERAGHFYSGRSGQRIGHLCKTLDIPRGKLHLDNALLCRAPKKQSAEDLKKSIACCLPRLQKTVKDSGAAHAVVFGSTALRAATGKAKIMPWIGAPMEATLLAKGGKPLIILPTLAPSLALMNRPHLWPVIYIHFDRAWQMATKELKWEWPPLFIEPGQKMLQALKRLHKRKLIGIDVETAGPSPMHPLTAVGLASTKEAISCPWPPEQHCSTKMAKLLRKEIKAILANPKVEKAAQNGSHDTIAFAEANMPIVAYKWDTMLMHGVVAPELKHDLGFIACIEFPAERWKTLFHVEGDHKGLERFLKAAVDELCTYNAKDAAILPFLVRNLKKRLINDVHRGMELYEGYFERSLIAAAMQHEGILINKAVWMKHRKQLGAKRSRALRDLRKVARALQFEKWETFNPRSHEHVRDFFVTHLGVRATKFSEKTGLPSVDAGLLQKLIASDDPHIVVAARAMLRYRRWHKLLSTYVLRLHPDHEKSHCDTKWIAHPSGRVQGTRGGRWSYQVPNMQNVPKPRMKKDRFGKYTIMEAPGMRDLFRARGNGWIVEADYSQLELRIIALLSGDKKLLDIFEKNGDPHTQNGMELFNVITLSKQERDLAKRFVYAANYGADAKTIWESLVVDFPGLGLTDVARMLDSWYMHHFAIREWQRNILRTARIQDYVECPLSGRRKVFGGVENVEPSKVYNYPVQGTGADIIDAAIVKVWNGLHKQDKLMLQVHDALIGESAKPWRLATLLQKHMAAPVELNGKVISFPVDFKVGRNWGQCVGYDTPKEIREALAA